MAGILIAPALDRFDMELGPTRPAGLRPEWPMESDPWKALRDIIITQTGRPF